MHALVGPAVIFVLLVVMLVLDPGRIDRRSIQLHWLRIAILLILALGTSYATVALTVALVHGSAAITNSASDYFEPAPWSGSRC